MVVVSFLNFFRLLMVILFVYNVLFITLQKEQLIFGGKVRRNGFIRKWRIYLKRWIIL